MTQDKDELMRKIRHYEASLNSLLTYLKSDQKAFHNIFTSEEREIVDKFINLQRKQITPDEHLGNKPPKYFTTEELLVRLKLTQRLYEGVDDEVLANNESLRLKDKLKHFLNHVQTYLENY